MWREHPAALALSLFLLAMGAVSILGVGNEGGPWSWDATSASRVPRLSGLSAAW